MTDLPVDGGPVLPPVIILSKDEVRNLYVVALRANIEVKDIGAVLPALHKLDEAVKRGLSFQSV